VNQMDVKWSINVEIVDEMGGFSDVITRVHWSAVGRSENGVARLSGHEDLDPPNESTYIDVSELVSMSHDDRRATVIGWAERLRPGFLADITAQLETKLNEPTATGSVVVL